MNKSRYYITTAIDYVNAGPHLGHAYEKIAADALARYHRLRLGHDQVFFLTGTDEHGAKVEKIARENGLTPKAWADQIVRSFQDTWAALNISYDRFIRTTDNDHELAVKKIFSALVEQGDIKKSHYEGWYCRDCEEFKLERDLLPEQRCQMHNTAAEFIKEENYVFLIAKYRDKLRGILENGDFLQPESRRREILNLLASFPDVSVSRKGLNWGIPVPFDSDHVIYVWIDALSNYITGIGYHRDGEEFQRWWPADLHVVGKDITKFHAIVWPAILMALGLEIPRQVFGHGFITLDAAKMSKVTGNVIDPRGLADRFGADALRYYLLRDVVFGKDGDFSYEGFESRVNADLANNLGNALNRILTFSERHFDNVVERPNSEPSSQIAQLAQRAGEVRVRYAEAMTCLGIADALAATWDLLDEVNLFVDREAPWSLAKLDDPEPLGHVVWAVLESLRVVAIMAWPAVPTLAGRVWEQIGAPGIMTGDQTDLRWEDTVWGQNPRLAFHTCKLGPIYPRIGSEILGKARKR